MTAALHSLHALFDPQTIAIVGASNNVQKFGGRPIRYMLESGYAGKIFPINPKGGEIQGLTAYKDIRDTPEQIDLAVVSVPAPHVVPAIRAAAEAEVRSVVIFSSGFAEVGAEGERWQQELREIAKTSGTRLVGPNCMGMLNTKSHAIGTFSSSFEHGWPKPGNVTILSQSGAVGSHTLVLARDRGIGIKGWMTTGNECDVDVADCMLYAADDPETEVIVIYMEGCQNPSRFIEALRRARQNRKPVIVMKVGASEVGALAAGTHTASLAGADDVFDSLFRQYGAYRAHSLEDLLEVAAACSAGTIPEGRNLGIVTISGGVGVLSSDAAAANNLEVPPLSEKTQTYLKDLMPFAAVRNPVDTTAQVLNNMQLLEQNLEAVLQEEQYDAVMTFLSSTGYSERVMGSLRTMMPSLKQRYPNSLIALSMMCSNADRELMESSGYLVIEDPSRAIATLAAMADIGESFNRPAADAPPPLPADAKAPSKPVLSEKDAADLLAAAGIPTVETRIAADAEAAVAAAEKIGYPVVMKILSEDIQHKSDIGGVKLNIEDSAAAADAFTAIITAARTHAADAEIEGVLVAPMVQGGVETILGTYQDPVFGPVVLFGLGGIFVEVLKDVTFRVAPFGVSEARRMIREVKGAALLDGVRGQGPADTETLAAALAALSVYAYEYRDSIESIDINPFLVQEKGHGAVAVDALVEAKSQPTN